MMKSIRKITPEEIGSQIDDIVEDLNYLSRTKWSIDYGNNVGILRNSKGFEYYGSLSDILLKLQAIVGE